MFTRCPRPMNGYRPTATSATSGKRTASGGPLARNVFAVAVLVLLVTCVAGTWWHGERGFEVTQAQSDALAEFRQRARSSVKAVAFAPVGGVLAAGVNDGRIIFHSTTSIPTSVAPLRQQCGIRCLAFSPKGSLLAAGGGQWGGPGGELKVWLWETGEQVAVLEARVCVNAVAFSPDGKLLIAVNEKGAVQLWRTDTWKSVGEPACSSVALRSMALSPDGRTLAVGDDSGRITTCSLPHAAVVRNWKAHKGMVCSLAYSPDGDLLASGGDDATARIWREGEIRPVHERGLGAGHCRAVAFLSNREVLSATGLVHAPASIQHWILGGGVRPYARGHTGAVFALAIDPHGKLFASAGGDGAVQLWRPAEPQAFDAIDCSLRESD